MQRRKYTLPFSFQRNPFSVRSLLGLLMLTAFFIPHLSHAVNLSDFNLPPQDANGWTILSPEVDSRIVYVDSSSGNDNTGQIYSPSDIGSNPQFPSGSVQAFQTLAAAYNKTRNSAPDWILLKSGEVWENESLNLHTGQSDTKRAVVSSYGSGVRPEIRTGAMQAISNLSVSNVIVSGIKFWAHTRDTDGPYFVSYAGDAGFNFYNGGGRNIRDILIEDCVFRSYGGNVLTGSLGINNKPITRFALRRTLISKSYETSSHSQGLYHTAAGQPSTSPASILLEENVFDHNGWRIQSNGNSSPSDGQATLYNHNTYFADAKKVMFIGNIFMRASSINNKWAANHGPQSASQVVMENNLYVEGEIGISAGGNEGGAQRFELFEFKNNVMTDIGRTRPTNRNLSWYMEIKDWDNGQIIGNLLLNQTAGLGNVYAINSYTSYNTRQIDIKNNYIYNLEAGSSAVVKFQNGENTTNVNFTDNVVQIPLNGPVAQIGDKGGYQFPGNNQYYSNGDPAKWFIINGNWASLADWISYTGDTHATIKKSAWNDPDRNLERYASEIGLGYGFNNFINALYKQSESNWRSDLTAAKINDWFREGFVTGDSSTNTPPSASFTVTCTDDGLACDFDAAASTDVNGNIVRYDWNFGDGNTGTGVTVSHNYSTGGDYTVVLTVTDNAGATHSTSQKLTTANQAPVAANDSASTQQDSTVDISILANDSDSDGVINSAAVAIGRDASHGSIVVQNNGIVSYTPDASFSGSDSFTYTVEDNDGALSNEAEVTVNVSVANNVPVTDTGTFTDDFSSDTTSSYTLEYPSGVATGFLYETQNQRVKVVTGDNLNLKFSQAVTASASGRFSLDFLPETKYPSGGVLTIILEQDQNNYYKFTTTDGYAPGSLIKVVNGVSVRSMNLAQGYIQNLDHTINIDFSPQQTTVDAIGQTISISGESTAIIVESFAVYLHQQDAYFDNIVFEEQSSIPINQAPIAANDSAATQQDSAVDISILANDSDSDGAINSAAVAIGRDASHGSTVVQKNGGVTYTPDASFNGSDSFTYTVEDNDGALSNEAEVTVNVSVANNVPVTDTGTFTDDFSSDTTSSYTLEYPSGVATGFLYETQNQRVKVVTGDNLNLKFSQAVTASASGRFSLDFLPETKYPSGGVLTIILEQDQNNYYKFTTTDGYAPGSLIKVVNGVSVRSMNLAQGYIQNLDHTINIDFSPQQTTVDAIGQTISISGESTAIIVESFAVYLHQQDAYFDNIRYEAFVSDTITGFQIISPIDGSTVTAGKPFMVEASVSSKDNVKDVDFWHDDWNHFGSVASAPYKMLMKEALSGDNPHPIRARVTYNDNSSETRVVYVNVK